MKTKQSKYPLAFGHTIEARLNHPTVPSARKSLNTDNLSDSDWSGFEEHVDDFTTFANANGEIPWFIAVNQVIVKPTGAKMSADPSLWPKVRLEPIDVEPVDEGRGRFFIFHINGSNYNQLGWGLNDHEFGFRTERSVFVPVGNKYAVRISEQDDTGRWITHPDIIVDLTNR
ncbi:MAG: hypothetical protein AB7T49_14550 [Oligoflexales bacterium]